MAPIEKKKPRVLNVGFHLPPPGGAAIFIDNLEKSKINDFCDIRGFDTDYPRWLKMYRPWTLLYLPIMYLHYVWVLSSFQPNLVHVHSPSGNPFFKSAMFMSIAKNLGFPIIAHIHGGGFKDYYHSLDDHWQRRVRNALALTKNIVVLSQTWKEFFKDLYPEDRIRVIENGIPLDQYPVKDFSKVRTGKEYLFVGRMTDYKGINELIAATAEVVKEHPDIHITMVGGEADKKFNQLEEYKAKCSSMGLDKNFTFTGELSGDNVISCYRKADIFILPSHTEGMPLVLIEAMASGHACIATSVGAIPEVLDSSGGIIVPAKSIGPLRDAMLDLTGNLDKITSMGKANRTKVEEKYSFDVVADNVQEVYEDVLDIH